MYEIVVPTLLGLEAFCAKELKYLGYEPKNEDGRVTFTGDALAVARANINLRTGERVLLKIGEFKAESFEELFENTKALPWESFIPKDGIFPVKGHSLKSKLASIPDSQAIIKKAIATRLGGAYGIEMLPETDGTYKVQFSIRKDIVTLMIDTSGAPLHKRGYRIESNKAPLRETIAAAMVMMSFWKFENKLVDPFCGSGTIPIEAAMFKRKIAPGINRAFAGEAFPYITRDLWDMARAEAKENERDLKLDIYGYDIDPECIEIAKNNADRAGVMDAITFELKNAEAFDTEDEVGAIICNPPYGERLGEKKECEQLYRNIGKSFRKHKGWSFYILTSNESFEFLFGCKSNKKRKVYNGMIKCEVFQFFGNVN